MVVLKILENQQGAATVIATSLKYSQAFNKVLSQATYIYYYRIQI